MIGKEVNARVGSFGHFCKSFLSPTQLCKIDRRSYKLHAPPLGSVCITAGWKKGSGPYLQWIAVHFDALDRIALDQSASEGGGEDALHLNEYE